MLNPKLISNHSSYSSFTLIIHTHRSHASTHSVIIHTHLMWSFTAIPHSSARHLITRTHHSLSSSTLITHTHHSQCYHPHSSLTLILHTHALHWGRSWWSCRQVCEGATFGDEWHWPVMPKRSWFREAWVVHAKDYGQAIGRDGSFRRVTLLADRFRFQSLGSSFIKKKWPLSSSDFYPGVLHDTLDGNWRK